MCIFCGEIFRMKVTCNCQRGRFKKILVMCNPFFKGAQGFKVFKVADVVADLNLIIPHQGEGVVKLSSTGKDWSGGAQGRLEGEWNITAGTSQNHLTPCWRKNPCHRVIARCLDIPIMNQEVISDPLQSFQCLLIIPCDWFL